MAGVDVAAPVANIGYLMVEGTVQRRRVALPGQQGDPADPAHQPEAHRGAGHLPAADQYVYLTRSPLTSGIGTGRPLLRHAGEGRGGQGHPAYQLNGKYDVCWYFNRDKTEQTLFNMQRR